MVEGTSTGKLLTLWQPGSRERGKKGMGPQGRCTLPRYAPSDPLLPASPHQSTMSLQTRMDPLGYSSYNPVILP